MKALLRYKNELIVAVMLLVFALGGKEIYSYYTKEAANWERQKMRLSGDKKVISRWEYAHKKYIDSEKVLLNKGVTELKQMVDKTAQKYNIKIIALAPEKIDREFYSEGAVKLKANAEYDGLVGFVQDLEEQGLIIEKISIKTKNDQDIQGFDVMGMPGQDQVAKEYEGPKIDMVIKAFILKEKGK